MVLWCPDIIGVKAYQTVAEARVGINAYSEFYNEQRPHQALGFPAEAYQVDQEGWEVATQEAGLASEVVSARAGTLLI